MRSVARTRGTGSNGNRRPRLLAGPWLLVAIVLVAGISQPAAAQPDARSLLEAAENSVFPDSFRARIVLTTREDGEETSTMELSLTLRQDTGAYMEVNAPARSRGLRFLQIDETLWMYNPRAGGGRAIRLSPRSAFQGSVFSNRDLSDPEFADDYSVELAGTETIEHPQLGRVEAWVVEAAATDDSLAYARIRSWVDRERRILLQTHYFAKSGLLFKTAVFGDVRELAGAERPTTIEMRSEQQAGLVSTMTILELEADPDLPARLFTRRHLTRQP